MKVLVLSNGDIERLMPMATCIDLMADTLARLAHGEGHQPLRMLVRPPSLAGLVALMPGYLGGAAARSLGMKAVCVFPANTSRGLDAHQGSVLLFSHETGELLALMNASAITAIRTAAVSGVATRVLARKDAHSLAIVGAGVEARTHLAAMACVRPLDRVRIASRTKAHAVAMAADVRRSHPFPIEVVDRVADAVRDADLVVLVTNSAEPVIERGWIAPGAHINAVGACVPTAREVDGATLAAASLYVDSRESALAEAGDLLLAIREGAIGHDHIRAELGELLVQGGSGRSSEDEITIFESLGLAVEDVACADWLNRRARETGVGTVVDF